jgi:two-component system phosphate regulon sensor histidine kinase PhoR
MDSEQRGRTIGNQIEDDMDPIEKMILRSMNEGVITLECNGDIYTVNPAALRLLGFTEEQLVGENFDEVFSHNFQNEEFKGIFSKVIHEGRPTGHEEVRFTRNDSQTLDLSVATAFLQVDECLPHMQNVVVVLRDITAFKAMERVRRRAVDHLSHELKTPLAIIEASVDHLGRAESSPASMSKSVERIKRNLNRLKAIQEIVEEILSPRPFRPRSFETVPTVERILDEIRGQSSHRSVELISDVEPLETDVIDPDILAIVLETLVKNAIENTPDQGEIIVSLKPVSEGALLQVDDRGVGIPVSDQAFIFEGFHHTQATVEYSSKKPFDFNAGGKGLELLRLEMLSEAGCFDISFESHRCRYIPTTLNHCPGRISECPHVQDAQGCQESGGTTFSVLFRRKDS